MKKILFLAITLLGAVCVEIYSSQVELKFDFESPNDYSSDKNTKGGEGCVWDDYKKDCVKSATINNCFGGAPGNDCEGVIVTPPSS